MLTAPFAELLAEATAIKTGRLDAGTVKLFQNNFTPNKSSLLADFTECDFTGYADVDIADWNDPYVDDEGSVSIVAPIATFAATGSAVTNLAYGWYYVTTGGALVMGERFDEPVNFAASGNTLNLVLKRTHNVAA
jgi:hypothetical protein